MEGNGSKEVKGQANKEKVEEVEDVVEKNFNQPHGWEKRQWTKLLPATWPRRKALQMFSGH
jgi:hypothetical protein